MDGVPDVVINFAADDVKHNLLVLLEKKMASLQIASRCHEVLANSYRLRSKFINYSGIAVTGLSFVLSTVVGASESNTNLPLAITSGVALLIKGLHQYNDPTEKAKAHAHCQITANDLAEEIEYIILKNNHTKESLQHVLDVYGDRIKSFRKTEEPIPPAVKHQIAG